MRIHAAHAKGAGADSCCIVNATSARCEHASALLQRDAGCQTSRLAPVLRCGIPCLYSAVAILYRRCQLWQVDMAAMTCHHARADLQCRCDVGVHTAEVHDGCACICLQCSRRQQQACVQKECM